MTRIHLVIILFISAMTSQAQSLIYEKEDSIKIASLLAKATAGRSINEYMTFFGTALKGVPYVAKTLDRNKKEQLVVNIRELDCTTLTENVLALSLCKRSGQTSFADFSNYLRILRYHRGRIAYHTRQHYFSTWIEEAKDNGFVTEPDYPASLAPKTKTLNINYMSTHATAYPQLQKSPAIADSIRKTEKALSGTTFQYIPKTQLRNYTALKKIINSGDIIVIITNKAGLDTSHIGIASWHADGKLHLLNASQIHKKVVDEPMTLYDYMQRHPSQLGIRVIKVKDTFPPLTK